MKLIPYGRQLIDKKDISEVAKVLASDWITQGPKVKEFEQILCNYTGAKYAVAVSSGTAALHIAALAAGIKPQDEVITSPVTFVASANCILYCGATPVFADIEAGTVNINPIEIEKKISENTKAIIPVHFAGLPCDMEKINRIAKKNNLIVIEDACHALGAQYQCGSRWFNVGGCKHSDMTVFSFHPLKHITTGEGGAITTNNIKLYEKLLALRSHGIYKNQDMTVKHGLWYYEMRELGFNYRITDFQCALGISQMKKLDTFIKRRRQIADIYHKAFEGIDCVEIPGASATKRHSYHIYLLKVNFRKIKFSRKKFMEALKNLDVQTQVHYIPIYRQPYYSNRYNLRLQDFRESESYYGRAISIPIYPAMKNIEVAAVIKNIKKLIPS